MKPYIAAAFALLTGYASPAFANWNYTQWGMSPEQVIAASRGSVHSEEDNGKLVAWTHGLLLAKGEVQIDRFNFKVGFYFDTNRRTLNDVFLFVNQCSAADAGKLRQLMTLKYGNPRDNFNNLRMTWVSPSRDIITLSLPYISNYEKYDGNGSCQLDYAPIPATL